MAINNVTESILNSTFCETFHLKNTSFPSKLGFSPTSPLQLVFVQVVLVNMFKTLFECILVPFEYPSFVPRVLGGVAVGPSFIGQEEQYRKLFLFAPKSMHVLELFQVLGFIFYIFLLSVRLDASVLKKCGKLEYAIGFSAFLFPLIITTAVSIIVRKFITLEPEIHKSLPVMAIISATTSFHSVLSLLTDLKFLNSELGRLALSSSMISGLCSWIFVAVCVTLQENSQEKRYGLMMGMLSRVFLFVFIIFGLRPIILWMKRRTPDGKFLKESHIFSIIIMVLSTALLGEYTGQHFFFGPAILGIATPEGPPVGPSLLEKFDCFVESVLMPCYIVNIGRRVDVFLIKPENFAVIEFVFCINFVAKLAAVILPSIYYKMPFVDALSLGILFSCKGFFDIQLMSHLERTKLLGQETFVVLVITSTFYALVFAPMVKLVYDPSKRYVAYRGRSIQHVGFFTELRVLTCVHEEDDVNCIINLLELSNTTKDSPLNVYVMNLRANVLGTLPRLTLHQMGNYPQSTAKQVNPIIKAFNSFEQSSQGLVSVECYSLITPHITMHNDICSMALDRSVSLLVILYSQTATSSVRIVNKKILHQAPCSVGILFPRGRLERPIVSDQTYTEIWVIFIGGPDDREALAFAARLVSHPSINISVLRLVGIELADTAKNVIERKRDTHGINEFRRIALDKSNVHYEEQQISGGNETTKIIGSFSNDFNLILTGRRHNPESSVLRGLSEWSEVEEMGVIGDLLVSSHSKASVFVLQQQASVVEGMIESPRSTTRMLARGHFPDGKMDHQKAAYEAGQIEIC